MHAILALMLTATVVVAAQQAALPDLTLSFSVTDKKGRPIEDLKREEVEVIENGSKRPVERMELDRRPLTVALVVDSSALLGTSLQADVVPAAVNFLKRMPPESQFSVWVTSDRPKKLVEDGADVKLAEDRLRQTAPFGDNAAVDTMIAASAELGKLDGRRTAVVAVTNATMGNLAIDIGAELQKASVRPRFMAVEVIITDQDARLQDALKLLVSRTGGFHERVFSTMAIETQLRRAQDQLAGQYRLIYKPGVDPRSSKVEVKSTRKDTRVRMSQVLSVGW